MSEDRRETDVGRKEFLRGCFLNRSPYFKLNRAFTWAVTVIFCAPNSSVGAGVAAGPPIGAARAIMG